MSLTVPFSGAVSLAVLAFLTGLVAIILVFAVPPKKSARNKINHKKSMKENTESVLALENGGTAASTEHGARQSFQLNEDLVTLSEPLSILKGGTGTATLESFVTETLRAGQLAFKNNLSVSEVSGISTISTFKEGYLDVVFDVPGLHLFQVPQGVTSIRIKLVGGGGGGGGGGSGAWGYDYYRPPQGFSLGDVYDAVKDGYDFVVDAAHLAAVLANEAAKAARKAAEASYYVNIEAANAISAQTAAALSTARDAASDLADTIGDAASLAALTIADYSVVAADATADGVTDHINAQIDVWSEYGESIGNAVAAQALAAVAKSGPLGAISVSLYMSISAGESPKSTLFAAVMSGVDATAVGHIMISSIQAGLDGRSPLTGAYEGFEDVTPGAVFVATLAGGVIAGRNFQDTLGDAANAEAARFGPNVAGATAFMVEFADSGDPQAAADAYLVAWFTNDSQGGFGSGGKDAFVQAMVLAIISQQAQNNTNGTNDTFTPYQLEQLHIHISTKHTEYDANVPTWTASDETSQKIIANTLLARTKWGGGGGGGSSGEPGPALGFDAAPVVVAVTPGTDLSVYVGAGGLGGRGGIKIKEEQIVREEGVYEGRNGLPGESSYVQHGETVLASRPGGRGGFGGYAGLYQDYYGTPLDLDGGDGGSALYYARPGSGGKGSLFKNTPRQGGAGGTYLEVAHPFNPVELPEAWYPAITRVPAPDGLVGNDPSSVFRGGLGGATVEGVPVTGWGGSGAGGDGGPVAARGFYGRNGKRGAVVLQLNFST